MPPAPQKPKVKLLIVDDDSFLLDVYARKFTERGYEVTTADDGEKALAKLRDGLKPSIILLDVIMPKIDGFALLEAIGKERLAEHAVPIVLSNQENQSDSAKAASLGALGYIIKANSIPSEVVSQVEAIVEKNKGRLN
jgi:CheY-like chemotaxis protein